DRRGRADVGRAGRGERAARRTPVPRDSCVAHLRGRDRGPAAHHRARAAEGCAVMADAALFQRERVIRFSECDPAGIVCYPQYFVMFNDVLEDWFSDELGVGFDALVVERRIGVPTVRLEVDFSAVSRMGDEVVLSLAIERLG